MKSIQRQFKLVNFLVAVLLLVLLVPVFAQDDPAPTVQEGSVSFVTPVATESAPTVPPPTASTDPMIRLSLWQLLAGLAGAFSLGGITIGTGAGVVAYRLRHNPATMKAIEGLATSTPPETVDKITNIVDKFQYSLTEVFALLREAYDKKAAADKTPEERDAVRYPGPSEDAGAQTAKTGEFPRAANGNP